jgi:hypothetical protein
LKKLNIDDLVHFDFMVHTHTSTNPLKSYYCQISEIGSTGTRDNDARVRGAQLFGRVGRRRRYDSPRYCYTLRFQLLIIYYTLRFQIFIIMIIVIVVVVLTIVICVIRSYDGRVSSRSTARQNAVDCAAIQLLERNCFDCRTFFLSFYFSETTTTTTTTLTHSHFAYNKKACLSVPSLFLRPRDAARAADEAKVHYFLRSIIDTTLNHCFFRLDLHMPMAII